MLILVLPLVPHQYNHHKQLAENVNNKKSIAILLTGEASNNNSWQNEDDIWKSMLEWIIFSAEFNHVSHKMLN